MAAVDILAYRIILRLIRKNWEITGIENHTLLDIIGFLILKRRS